MMTTATTAVAVDGKPLALPLVSNKLLHDAIHVLMGGYSLSHLITLYSLIVV